MGNGEVERTRVRGGGGDEQEKLLRNASEKRRVTNEFPIKTKDSETLRKTYQVSAQGPEGS